MAQPLASFIPVEPWQLSIESLEPGQLMLAETLLAQANGYIGSRGTLEEPERVSCEGVYLNGVYQREPIPYGETAFAFATHNNKMVQLPNGKRLELELDGERLTASAANPGLRVLDLRDAVLTRRQRLVSQTGKVVNLESRRFVSLAEARLMCMEWRLTAENFSGEAVLHSALDASYRFSVNKDDPRVGQLSIEHSLALAEHHQRPGFNLMRHRVAGTDFVVTSASLDEGDMTAMAIDPTEGKVLSQRYRLQFEQGKTLVVRKWIAYGHDELGEGLGPWLAEMAATGFAAQLESHRRCWQQFWDDADVQLDGDPALQQGLRFNLFHLFQSAGRNGITSIGAKGLTGHGYDGHYFWDSEIYVVPSLAYSQPAVARSLLEYRIHSLEAARNRARQMSHQRGALFAWRTIGGEECSAYFPAGTAQYHINSAIAYGFKSYWTASGDNGLFWQGGMAVLVETARLWLELGYFNPRRDGRFCIDCVTGPDEYTAIVNNNYYTNAMAKMHLEFVLAMAKTLAAEDLLRWQGLALALGFDEGELARFGEAAAKMYLGFDSALGIHRQDDSFLDKKPWDFAGTPKDKYPLLLHFHPLVIYRHQVLKQADVVLANYLLDDGVSGEQKARDLAYYEPLTTHDSTLSSCIHAIAFAEAGALERAYGFFHDTVRMDLDNNHGNTEYGVHIACMAGSLAAVINGFAGLRLRADGPHFRPQLPAHWQGYSFKVRYRGRQLALGVDKTGCRYRLLSGPPLTLYHQGRALSLGEQPVHLPWQEEGL